MLLVDNGMVMLNPAPGAGNGSYAKDRLVTLVAFPDDAGSSVAWGGVATSHRTLATVKMSGDRDVAVAIADAPEQVDTTVTLPAPVTTIVTIPIPIPTPVPAPVAPIVTSIPTPAPT